MQTETVSPSQHLVDINIVGYTFVSDNSSVYYAIDFGLTVFVFMCFYPFAFFLSYLVGTIYNLDVVMAIFYFFFSRAFFYACLDFYFGKMHRFHCEINVTKQT